MLKINNDLLETSYDTLRLLHHIINHDSICTHEIASILKNSKSERSNLRHFITLREFFLQELNIEVFERSSKGCYRIINKDTLHQALNLGDKKELMSYVHILKQVLPHYYATLDDEMKKSITKAEKDAELTYLFHNNPLEDFANSNILKTVEKAVKSKRKSTIRYRSFSFDNVKPLRIVFMEGNLYLACLSDDEQNNGFKFLRISMIENFDVSANEFNETEKVLDAREFLNEFQTPFSSFQTDYTKVIIKASPNVAHHFLQKKHLRS